MSANVSYRDGMCWLRDGRKLVVIPEDMGRAWQARVDGQVGAEVQARRRQRDVVRWAQAYLPERWFFL